MSMHPWRHAMQQALYGPGGFFTTGAGPAAHFRTSVHAAPEFAAAIARLATDVDAILGEPASQIVDVGAGNGELLVQLRDALAPALRSRTQLTAVEVRERPSNLPAAIGWTSDMPDDVVGIIIANEWLDNVPLDVCEKASHGESDLALVLVDEQGREQLGPPLDEASNAWLLKWWPQTTSSPGDRAEIGLTRDNAWHGAVTKLARGLAIAIDYGHVFDQRVHGGFAGGTLRGFRDGHVVAPTPNGNCDITADVAIDACAAAASDLARSTIVSTQREVLHALGLSAVRPPLELAHTAPADYIAELSAASRAGELMDSGQLGGYYWLIQARNMDLPASLRLVGPS